MSIITNREIMKLAKSDPTYKDITAKLTDEVFTETGFNEMSRGTQGQILSDFFGLSVRIVLQKISQPRPRIPREYQSIVEEYDNEFGGIFQRISTQPIKPISPKFKNLQTGGSVDPFIIRKPETSERFYQQNFDWQNLLTLQKIELKKIFLAESGINTYVDGITKSLNDSYNISKYETMKECLHGILSSNLKSSQIIKVKEITQQSSQDDLIDFMQAINAVYNLFDTTVMSRDFNKLNFMHGTYPEDYTLLIRGDVKSNLVYRLERVSYQIKNIGIQFNVVVVKDFGGTTYEDLNGTQLKPIYDDFGAVVGFNATGEGTPLPDEQLKVIDPHENLQAVLIQKGSIFTTKQQEFEIETIYNPAGKYLNLWASQPDASFNVDNTYDVIVFEKDETQTNNTEQSDDQSDDQSNDQSNDNP